MIIDFSKYSIKGIDFAGNEEDVQSIGRFTINASGKTVGFAPGNLQCTIDSGPDTTGYIYVPKDWCFAEHQWDSIGSTGNVFAIDSKLDLFGWVGQSSQYDNYGVSKSSNDNDFGTVATDTLKTDWGNVPAIKSALGSGWRTLTSDEWDYIFKTRVTSSGLRFTKAKVNNIAGMILLPDNWSTSYYTLYDNNSGTVSYSGNTISKNVWETTFEPNGAVFLPVSGYRSGTSLANWTSEGRYWANDTESTFNARNLYFTAGTLNTTANNGRHYGFAVRLVH